MNHGAGRIAFVVATKDRPAELRRLLGSLARQSVPPDQVVVVDASAEPVAHVVRDFPQLNPLYLSAERPSASGQRNAGIRAVEEGTELVGFIDDDAVLAPGAMVAMRNFWRDAGPDIGGAAFNCMNPTRGGLRWLKNTRLARWLGLYSPEPGRVMPSGWQTMIGTVEETMFVDWLPSTASVWRRDVLECVAFDEFFDGYSYCEDVEFSYSVGRRYRLAVVADAGFFHYPAAAGRRRPLYFGQVEARNRLYFVRKHGLSVESCCLGIAVRAMMTLGAALRRADPGHGARVVGNCLGLAAGLSPSLIRGRKAGICRDA